MIDIGGRLHSATNIEGPAVHIRSQAHTRIGPVDSPSIWKDVGIKAFRTELAVSLVSSFLSASFQQPPFVS